MWGNARPGDREDLMVRSRRCRSIRAHQEGQRPRKESEQERERQDPVSVGFPLQTHEMVPFPSSLCATRRARKGGLFCIEIASSRRAGWHLVEPYQAPEARSRLSFLKSKGS